MGDTEERRRYLNARSTIETLLRLKAIPVVNENDTVATSEIRYGDNDRLAARVASMCSADCLVLLSDIDGLYTAPPATNPDAKLVPEVREITAEIEAMAGDAGTELSKGGMKTKVAAAKIATGGGAHMVIALGKVLHPLAALGDPATRATWFLAPSDPVAARKRWIAGTLEPRGVLVLDAGAVAALEAGKSLLAGWRAQSRGRFRARRRGNHPCAGRARSGTRADGLWACCGGQNRWPKERGDRRDTRLRRPRRDRAPG